MVKLLRTKTEASQLPVDQFSGRHRRPRSPEVTAEIPFFFRTGEENCMAMTRFVYHSGKGEEVR